jgi:hypothetical protein
MWNLFFLKAGAGSCNDLINIFTSPSNQNPEEKATYLYQPARNVEEAFFYGYQEGQEYTVGCWINEKTKVRSRSN